MANFNASYIFLGGHLTADPELKVTPSGVRVLHISVAVRDKSPRIKGEEPRTNFYKVTFFGDKAVNVSKYFKKGSSIAITGDLSFDEYKARDGQYKKLPVIIASDYFFVDSKSEANADTGFNPVPDPSPASTHDSNSVVNISGVNPDEGLPF